MIFHILAIQRRWGSLIDPETIPDGFQCNVWLDRHSAEIVVTAISKLAVSLTYKKAKLERIRRDREPTDFEAKAAYMTPAQLYSYVSGIMKNLQTQEDNYGKADH